MSFIAALATQAPPYRYEQQEVLDYMLRAGSCGDRREERLLRAIYQQSGIRHRYSVLPDFAERFGSARLFNGAAGAPSVAERMAVYRQEALRLAHASLQQTLTQYQPAGQAPLQPQDITHIITVSCTGLAAPGLETDLIQEAGLRANTQRFAVNFMGCYAAFQGLKIADALCRADPAARVLVVAVELCTLHFMAERNSDQWLANALFADGAAACLVLPDHCRAGQQGRTTLRHFSSAVEANGRGDMAWHLGPKGFQMRLSNYVPELVERGMPPLLTEIYERLSLSPSAIDHWAIHPGGRRILEAMERVAQLGREDLSASYYILQEYGNMSSPTVLYVLAQLLAQQPAPPARPQTLLAAGFGPGLSLEAGLLEYQAA
jgi:predicted naringenin-chalcone synthase